MKPQPAGQGLRDQHEATSSFLLLFSAKDLRTELLSRLFRCHWVLCWEMNSALLLLLDRLLHPSKKRLTVTARPAGLNNRPMKRPNQALVPGGHSYIL